MDKNSSLRMLVSIAVVTALLGFGQSVDHGRMLGILDRKNVTVVNNLSKGTELTVHCKSKDDDLGAQVIQWRASWSFRFRVNFWKSTLFYCKFQWGPNDVHWFDVFNAKSSTFSQCNVCVWNVSPDGPCHTDFFNGTYLCYPWNNPN